MKRLISACAACLCSFNVFSQGDVPVDLFSGSPAISIPFWTISAPGISQTVGISYNSNGLRLEQSPEFVGLGWSLIGSGRVSREVRGLPDDFDGIVEGRSGKTPLGTSNYDDRRGWLQPMVSNGVKPAKSVLDFAASADLSSATCSDESADHSALNGFGNFIIDTEPDMFHFSGPGLSGSFVFDNSATTPQVRLIPYQPIKVEYVTHQITKDLLSFTITTDDGTVYHFGRLVEEKHSMRALTAAQYFARHAGMYGYEVTSSYLLDPFYGHVVYNSQWMLTKVSSVTGGSLTYDYTQNDFEVIDTLKVGVRKDHVADLDVVTAHESYYKLLEQRLAMITSSTGQSVGFHYDDDGLVKKVQVADTRRSGSPLVKEVLLYHQAYLCESDPYSRRHFLSSVQERSGSSILPGYHFTYNGVFVNGTVELPSYHSKAKDLWGFYNANTKNATLFPVLYVYPALTYPDKVRTTPIDGYIGTELILPGSDRRPNAEAMKTGVLNKIEFPGGGSTVLEYEPNSYYDAVAQQTFIGGGLRIRSVKTYDGLSTTPLNVRTYVYEDSPGQSSGRLVHQPVFYIPTAKYIGKNALGNTVTKTYAVLAGGTAQELWDRLLVRTEEDQSKGSYVRYKKVTVLTPGAGKTVVEYDLPGIAGDASANSGEWNATSIKFARSTACEEMGIMNAGGTWRYPFVANPNYDYKRGLITKSSSYNESGTIVSETTTTYQDLFKPGVTLSTCKVWALEHERFVNSTFARIYGKYYLLTDVVRVPSVVVNKTYDESTVTKFTTYSTQYTYSTGSHRNLSRVSTTDTDGTVLTNEMKYPLDYATTTVSGTDATMIKKLQDDFRNSVVVEQISKMQRPGAAEKVTGATLMLFNTFGTNVVLPSGTKTLRIFDGITNFSSSTISGGVFTHDTRYEDGTKVIAYENTYKVPNLIQNPRSLQVSGTLWGYDGTLPVASIAFAKPDEVAFSDFETDNTSSFSQTSFFYGSGRTGSRALHPSATISRTIVKGGNLYTLSGWAKTNGTSFNLVVTIKNTSNTVLSTITVPVTSPSGKYQRFSTSIVTTSFPASFKIEIKGQSLTAPGASSPGLVPVIDDVAFHPEHAQLSMNAYDVPWGVTAGTDYTGMSAFTEFDALGRAQVIRDFEGNIGQRNTFYYNAVADQLTATFSVYDYEQHFAVKPKSSMVIVTAGVPFRLIADENSHEGVTYEWDIGDGAGFVTGNRIMEPVLPAGTRNIKLRVSKTGYTTITSSAVFVKIIPALAICAKGMQEYNPATNSSTVSYTCAQVTSAPGQYSTYFKLNSSFTGTQNWFIRETGTEKWTPLTSFDGLGQIYIQDIHARDIGFDILCETYSAGSITGRSNIMSVTFK